MPRVASAPRHNRARVRRHYPAIRADSSAAAVGAAELRVTLPARMPAFSGLAGGTTAHSESAAAR